MSSPETIAWLQLFGILAGEVCLVVGLVFILHRLVRSIFWRRALWQASLICLLLMIISEVSGLGRGAAIFFFGQTPDERKFSVQTLSPSERAMTPRPERVVAELPVPLPTNEASLPRGTWWPGIIWLIGFGLIAARIIFAQLLLVTLRWRQEKISDADCRKRTNIIAGRLGFRRKIYLLQTRGLASPVAFGIFWPSIGLPKDFTSTFTVAQQDAMLAHELAHLAARDPLWYLLADLISAFLWWHPGVWWARRRLHASSELAADEATAILENGPSTLAECLLTLSRQMTGLRRWSWMGVDGGFRSNLGQRIQRLLNLREARQPARGWQILFLKASFTILLAGVVVFASGWIQNGKAVREKDLPLAVQKSWDGSFASIVLAALVPEKTEATLESAPAVETNEPPAKSNDVSDAKMSAAKLLGDGKLLYEMGKFDKAEEKLKQTLDLEPNNRAATYYLDLIREQRFAEKARGEKDGLLHPTDPPKIAAQANTEPLRVTNPPAAERPKQIWTSKGRKDLLTKLNTIRLDQVAFDKLPLGEVLKFLAAESRRLDADKLGINFVILTKFTDNIPITISPPLENVLMVDVLDAITRASPTPLKYAIEDYAIVFSEKKEEAPALFSRAFKVDPGTFLNNLEKIDLEKLNLNSWPDLTAMEPNPKPPRTNDAAAVHERIKTVFKVLGVDLNSQGRSMVFKDRLGMLYVRGTLQDLEAVEKVLGILDTAPPQLTIDVKIVEVDQAASKKLGTNWLQGRMVFMDTNQTVSRRTFLSGDAAAVKSNVKRNSTNAEAAAMMGILTDPQYRTLLKTLENTAGCQILAAPKVTTLSGRQAHLAILDTMNIVTGVTPTNDSRGGPSFEFQTQSIPFGPTLDVIPNVSKDGYAIDSLVMIEATEFLGYDDPGKFAVKAAGTNREAAEIVAGRPLPRTRKQETVIAANVWDGQTMMFGGFTSETVNKIKKKVPVLGDLPLIKNLFRSESKTTVKKNLIMFITPTIIDPAGNRLHSEGEIPFAQNSIPKQPATRK